MKQAVYFTYSNWQNICTLYILVQKPAQAGDYTLKIQNYNSIL